MKKLFVILCLAVGVFKIHSFIQARNAHLVPLQKEPYIVIYGRETCGNCQELKAQLQKRGIKYFAKDIDYEVSAREIENRMTRRGIDTSSFTLPVVDVNTRIATHPSLDWVLSNYGNTSGGK